MLCFDAAMSVCMSITASLYFTIFLHVCQTYENLAFNKKAEQSSFYNEIRIDPKLAVDNNTDQSVTNCARTNLAPEVWWRVDLGEIKSINDIRVFYRNDSDANVNNRINYHAGFSLYVSESKCDGPTGGYLCYKNKEKLPPLESDHVCKRHGRYVTYYNERTSDRTDLPPIITSFKETIAEICEFQVFGCAAGVYGKACDKPCPINCRDNLCDIETGACLNCNGEFKGSRCDISASPLTGSSNSELSLYRGAILVLILVLLVLIATVVTLHYKLSKLKSSDSKQNTSDGTTQPRPGSQGHTYATLGVELNDVRNQYEHLGAERTDAHTYLHII